MGGTPEPADDARASGARRWLFGAAVLDERSLELRVGGEAVSVDRKPLEVLLHLLHHAGEVVTKDELLEAVWPGRVLSDSALTSCMARLREALHDEDQTLIKTQHGYGYRLVAKVQVEAAVSPPPPRFDFKSGDHPPGRPNWNLVERLGTGGHGEVWLARNEKTRQARVFKFALDSAALISLKREITLYRLLHDALGEKASIVEIHEWNLEQPPYFIEAEYIESGSLVTWAQAQGGLDKVTLETRLEIAAQIAEALAAAHSVGVLHKDLKPSNILVVSSPLPTDVGRGRAEGAGEGRVQIKLADFGSGGVLDTGRLEAMGITRLGFTKTIADAGTTSGTAIYFAPEVIAGQPFTVQADIYALGVMLYQLVVCDFRRPLASGWEQEIGDALLSDDIANAVAGNLAQRLSDALVLSQRLRSIEPRRQQRRQEIAARAEADRQRLALARFKARRPWIVTALLALGAGFALSIGLYRDAARARDSALAVSAFFSQDVLSIADPFQTRPAEVTVKDLIDRSAKAVDARLSDQPEAAAQAHFALGHAYRRLGESALMDAQLRRAAELMDSVHGPGNLGTMLARSWDGEGAAYDTARAIPMFQELQRKLRAELGPAHPQVVDLRCSLARLRLHAGELSEDETISEYRAAIAEGRHALQRDKVLAESVPKVSWTLFLDPGATDLELVLNLKQGNLVQLLLEAGRFQEASDEVSSVLPALTGKYGERHFHPGWWRSLRGRALLALGRAEEAEADILAGLAAHRRWFGEESGQTRFQLQLYGEVLRGRGKLPEAHAVHRQVLNRCLKAVPDFRAETAFNSCASEREALAKTLHAQGDRAAARRLLEEALESRRRLFPADDPRTRSTLGALIALAREQRDSRAVQALERELAVLPAAPRKL